MTPAEHFESLGNAVVTAWTTRNYDNKALPEIATEAIKRSGICERVTWDDILRWISGTPWLPPQPNLDVSFGEPPIAVYYHSKLYIEVLYWTDGTPDVHQHGFSGAFAVLEGSSIHTSYTFEVDTRINANMLLGELTLQDVKLLGKGAVEPIRSGSQMIHSVFHLATPSVTVVIRTHSDSEAQPQYSYYRPYVAINPFYRDPEAIRRVQIVGLLDKVKSDQFEEMTTLAIQKSTFYAAYRILEYLQSRPDGQSSFEQFVEIARRTHGPDIERLRAVILENDRAAVLRSRRSRVIEPDQRLLLALLMNVPSRAGILSLIKSRFPERDPRQVAAEWAFGMSGIDLSGIEFNDTNQALFRYLMEGLSVPDIIRRMDDEYDLNDVPLEKLAEHCAAMRRSWVFKPLLEATT